MRIENNCDRGLYLVEFGEAAERLPNSAALAPGPVEAKWEISGGEAYCFGVDVFALESGSFTLLFETVSTREMSSLNLLLLRETCCFLLFGRIDERLCILDHLKQGIVLHRRIVNRADWFLGRRKQVELTL